MAYSTLAAAGACSFSCALFTSVSCFGQKCSRPAIKAEKLSFEWNRYAIQEIV
jgi:hypothetical protein